MSKLLKFAVDFDLDINKVRKVAGKISRQHYENAPTFAMLDAGSEQRLISLSNALAKHFDVNVNETIKIFTETPKIPLKVKPVVKKRRGAAPQRESDWVKFIKDHKHEGKSMNDLSKLYQKKRVALSRIKPHPPSEPHPSEPPAYVSPALAEFGAAK